MPVEDKREKEQSSAASRGKEEKDLSRLLDLLNTPASKQQLPSISWVSDENQNHQCNPLTTHTNGPAYHHQSTEAVALENFSSKYQNVRNFSSNPQEGYFGQVFTALVKQRVCCLEWIQRAPPENILRVLICLRMLMRDPVYQAEFFNLGGVKVLSERLQSLTESYLEIGEEQFTVDILKEMTNICQKLSADVQQREWLVACGTHRALVLLLSASDIIVLHCSLYALISLSQSERPRAMIGELNCTEILLRILQDYDVLSKKLAATLLRVLCGDSSIREQVKVFEGIPICLSLLHCDNLKLLWNVVWIIVQLAEDPDSSNDIRFLGGIPLLLALLQDRKLSSDGYTESAKMTMNAERGSETFEESVALKSAACAALTELVLNDTNGQQIVQRFPDDCRKNKTTAITAPLTKTSNGVYLLGLLILPQETPSLEENTAVESLQKSGFRTLRFLFSMERNRQLFKRLFPPSLFENFIDVGHYVRDLNAYKSLVEKLNSLSEEDVAVIRNNILATNQNKAPSHSVGSYDVLELLGSGAFGSVYKVRKKNAGQTFFAMKEMSVHNPALGNTPKDRGKSVGEIVNETTIMKEQLRHPNVVRYYKAFQQKDKLYVIMELVEGAPLGEHFNSLIEKGATFPEDRIWHIFIQIVLALRYIHKEKHIVHRDLTPNNIMLGENDKVTITDFGLAKQRNPDASKLTSVVGTVLYSCPEVVQGHPYGEKADVWAAGCILYQMSTLKATFYSSNMLALVKKIVEAQYDPIPPGQYSDKLTETVTRCLTAEPDERPDIVQVAGIMSEVMLIYMDRLRSKEIGLEKKLERERKRTQRHYMEATRNMQDYHRLFWASQERYDKLASLSSSAGAVVFKNANGTENSDGDFEASEVFAEFRRNSEAEVVPRVDSGIDVGALVRPRGGSCCTGASSVSDQIDVKNDGPSSSNMSERQESSRSPGRSRKQGNCSPNISRRHRKDSSKGGDEPSLNGHSKISTEKASGGHNKSNHEKTVRSSPSKSVGEKSAGGRTSNEKSGNSSSGILSTAQAHTFAVPRPPQQRKGARRPLQLDSLAINKTPTTGSSVVPPSPTVTTPTAVDVASRRTQSSSAVEMYRRQSSGQMKARPPTAAATLSISPRKVRQINDPISQILNQLHKIIFITQLPPTLAPNPQRRIVERFKRALFTPQSSSFNLKSEVKKVTEGSREVIDLKFGFGDPAYICKQQDASADKLISGVGLESADGQEIGITYEMIQNMIENVLMESGYYDMSPHARNRAVPLGPIGAVPMQGMNMSSSKRGGTSS